MTSATRLFAVLTANMVNGVITMTLLISWLLGFVLAKGFWSTLACTFPFYAWYLVVERVAIMTGFISP